MNTRKAKKFYDIANRKYFHAQLPDCVQFVKFSGVGYVGPNFPIQGFFQAYPLTIHYHRKLSKKKAKAVILHEMVHLLEFWIHGIDHATMDPDGADAATDWHGTIFREWQAFFRRIEIEI
jgi:hypothetical protein